MSYAINCSKRSTNPFLGKPFNSITLIPLLHFGNRRFEWDFQLAAVEQPLLGADFLRAYNLHIVVAGEQILDATSLVVKSVSAKPPIQQSPFFTALVDTPRE